LETSAQRRRSAEESEEKMRASTVAGRVARRDWAWKEVVGVADRDEPGGVEGKGSSTMDPSRDCAGEDAALVWECG
jgi:hypothetical protein